jgi:hypothetical protein
MGNPQMVSFVTFAVPFSGVGPYPLDNGVLYYLVGGDVVAATYDAGGEGTVLLSLITEEQVVGAVSFDASASSAQAPVGPAAAFSGTFEAEIVIWDP